MEMRGEHCCWRPKYWVWVPAPAPYDGSESLTSLSFSFQIYRNASHSHLAWLSQALIVRNNL